MNPNPYAPPQAHVTDAPPDTGQEFERPITVRVAAWLLWLSLAVFVVSFLIRIKSAAFPAGSLKMAIATTVLNVAVSLWLNLKIVAGRNWARIVWLVLFLIGVLLTAALFLTVLRKNIANPLLFLQGLVSMVTAVLLLTPSAGRWFRRK